LKTCIDLGSSHGYQTHKCSHQLEELPGHTLLVNVDQVEDGDEGLSPGERGKQQAERAQASDGQGPLLGRKRRAESAAGSEQGKVPRVAHTQRVFLQSVSDMMGSFQVVDFAGGLLLLLCR
jgi:hypothetical protein